MDGSRAGNIMPIELIVVGEDEADRQWLLVQGSDGRCYKYHPRRQRLVPVERDEWWARNTDRKPEEDEPPSFGTIHAS